MEQEETQVVDTAKGTQDTQDTQGEQTVSQMQEQIDKLKNINSEVIQSRDKAKAKLREVDSEVEKKANDDLVEKEKFKELYEKANDKLNSLTSSMFKDKVDKALQVALDGAGSTSTGTALKLIDTTDIKLNDDGTIIGIQNIIDRIKTDHTILFQEVKPSPTPIVPTEDGAGNGELDITKLNMKDSKDRALYSKYRKTHGIS